MYERSNIIYKIYVLKETEERKQKWNRYTISIIYPFIRNHYLPNLTLLKSKAHFKSEIWYHSLHIKTFILDNNHWEVRVLPRSCNIRNTDAMFIPRTSTFSVENRSNTYNIHFLHLRTYLSKSDLIVVTQGLGSTTFVFVVFFYGWLIRYIGKYRTVTYEKWT